MSWFAENLICSGFIKAHVLCTSATYLQARSQQFSGAPVQQSKRMWKGSLRNLNTHTSTGFCCGCPGLVKWPLMKCCHQLILWSYTFQIEEFGSYHTKRYKEHLFSPRMKFIYALGIPLLDFRFLTEDINHIANEI